MARIEPAGTQPSNARPRFRVRVALPSAARTGLAIVAAIGGAEAPETWLRALAIAVILLIAYRAGSEDGRRDLSIEIVGGRNDRPARRPAPVNEDPAGGEPA